MAARFGNKLGRTAIAACLLAAAGCASTDDMQTSLRKVTPSFMLSDQDKAERSLKDPTSLHVAYGKFQEQVGQPGEARKSYEAALHEDPQSVDAILGLARLDQLADNGKEAEAGFQKALKLKPGDAHVLAAAGQFYVWQKRWPEAFQALDAAIAAAPHEIYYRHALAVAKTASGDINGGLALFTELVGPEKAHFNVAYLLRQQGKTDAAIQECRASLAINPNFEPAKAMLTQIHDRQLAGDPRTLPRGASQAAFAGGVGPGQAVSSTSQTSWQTSARSVAGTLPVTNPDATFEPASPPPAAPARASSAANDPWANTPQ